jgi:hypothetical protein
MVITGAPKEIERMPSAVIATSHDRRVSIVAAAEGARPVAVTVVMAYEACHFRCKKQRQIKLQPLPLPFDVVVPALIADLGEPTAWRYVEFFTANIRNPRTRRAYARACPRFFAWCEERGLVPAAIRMTSRPI